MTRFLRHPELEAALVAHPDDDATCEVYADWLQQQGSPHGELISVQRALRGEPRSVALRRREAALLEAHGAALVGPALVPQIHLLGWDGGFTRSADVNVRQLIELCERPAGLLLRELAVRDEDSLQPAIDRLAAVGSPLAQLQLAIQTYDTDLAHDIGDVHALWPALGHLERLEIRDGAIVLGKIASPRLRELVLRPTTLTRDNLHSLAGAALPALTHLELWFEHDPERYHDERDEDDRWAHQAARSSIDLDDVVPLLAASQLPALRHLMIANTPLGDALCARIVTSPLARQLHSLALIRGTITSAGVAHLAHHRAAFPRLERIDLDHNRIAPGASLEGLPRDGAPWTQRPLGVPRHTL